MAASRDGEKAGGKRNVSLWGAEGHSGEEGDDTKGQSCVALRLATQGKNAYSWKVYSLFDFEIRKCCFNLLIYVVVLGLI